MKQPQIYLCKNSARFYNMDKCGYYVRSMVVRIGDKIGVSLSRFMVCLTAHRAISSPVSSNVQEWKVAVPFRLHGELNVLVDTV
jgi:hypothetical protein